MQKLIEEFESLSYPMTRIYTTILPLFRIASFQQPTLLLSPGQILRRLYLVRKGYVRIYRKDKGRKVTRRYVGEGDWVSLLASFILQQEAIDFMEVCRNSEVYYIEYEDYDRLFREDGPFAVAAQLILVKLAEAADKREDLFRLANPVSQRLDVVLENAAGLQDYASQKDIADYAFVSASTVSRYRSRNK